MKNLILVITIFFSSSIATAQFNNLSEQADYYQSLFGNPKSYTSISKSSYNKGETRPKALLKGAFYFGGSDVKRELLSNSFRQKLCQDGFSKVFSVYKKVNQTVNCDNNSYNYVHIGESKLQSSPGDKVYNLISDLYDIINANGSIPAIYLHCHYGVHASNTIAQMVLMQFCGISKEQAKSNWDIIDLYDSLGNEGRAKQFQKIDNFNSYSEFSISKEQKNLVCY